MNHVSRSFVAIVAAICFISFCVISNLAFAQFDEEEPVCGTIFDLSGRDEDYFDCNNPFDSSGTPPFTVEIDGQVIAEGAEIVLAQPQNVTLSLLETGGVEINSVFVYQRDDDDYQAVDVDRDGGGFAYEIDFNRPGEHVLVINRPDADDVSSLPNWSLFATAHAQEFIEDEPSESPEIYSLSFVVAGEPPAEPCGVIITSSGGEQPYFDCDNPFMTELGTPSPVFFGDTELLVGTDVMQDLLEWGQFSELSGFVAELYQKQGDDYQYVRNIRRESDYALDEANYTINDIERLEDIFFKELNDEVFNLRRLRRENPGLSLTGPEILLINEFEQDFAGFSHLFKEDGEYLLVFASTAYDPVLSGVPSWLVPLVSVAHAQFNQPVFSVPFTVNGEVVSPPPEPTGPSSVLFLPGIQASRLYQGDEEGVRLRWEPFGNRDVRSLTMTTEGQSVNDIYTEDILDSIYGFIDIYDSLIDHFDSLVEDDVIVAWTPFAYDWRYDVLDVATNGTRYQSGVESAITEIEELAENSKSGQVTIVGHSNGGLLAKALMVELENQDKADLVDKVVFLASPQIGTPKAIGSILHGYDQQDPLGGFLIDDSIARSVILNLPGAYGLLPSQQYFDAVNDLVISFDASESTADFRAVYGNAVQDEAELFDFMVGADGRAAATTVEEAALANRSLYEASRMTRQRLDGWQAPEGVTVVEVVGVGLNTVSGFEYTEFTERVCGDFDLFGNRDCSFETYYEAVPYISQYGDETVMAPSAEAYQGQKTTYYIDLDGVDKSGGESQTVVNHANIGENESVQEILTQVLLNRSTSTVAFVSTDRPVYANARSMLGTHSPVDIALESDAGERVGLFEDDAGNVRVLEEIPGSSYFRLGSSTYIIVPDGIDYEARVTGYDDGGATLTRHEIEGEKQTLVAHISIATVTASTTILLSRQGKEEGNVLVDEDGDGKIDVELTPDGDVLQQASYDGLRSNLKDLPLDQRTIRWLVRLTNTAEYFGNKAAKRPVFKRLEKRFLRKLNRHILWMERKGKISKNEASKVTDIIRQLRNR